MTNATQQLKDAIAAVNCKALDSEIDYFLSIDPPDDDPDYEPRNLFEALDDAHDLAEDVNDRKVVTAARKVFIAIGYFRHITNEEMRGIQTLGRAKKYDFILGGKKYVWNNDFNEDVYK